MRTFNNFLINTVTLWTGLSPTDINGQIIQIKLKETDNVRKVMMQINETKT